MVFDNAGKFHIETAIFNIGNGQPQPPPPPSSSTLTGTCSTLPPNSSSAAHERSRQLNNPAPSPNSTSRPLDILFLQDATGSQGPYIRSARAAIQTICTSISSSAFLSQGALRFGLVAFRDHPPQDSTFVTKNYGFTCDVEVMKMNLAGLTATGGGDGPEAVTTALAEALNMEWDNEAVKIVVLITDAPPHGLGESGDGFPDGSPDQNDPIEIARQMAERGITLYVVACEPTLSTSYVHAVDFYNGICSITSGKMVPLLDASQLGEYIVGSAVETMETEAIIQEYQKEILEDVYVKGAPVQDVVEKVHAELSSRKTQVSVFSVEDVYELNHKAQKSSQMWSDCENLKSSPSKSKGSTHQPSGSTLKREFATLPPPTGSGRARRRKTSSSASPLPQVSLSPQAIDRPQTDKVVMKCLARNAKVAPNGVLIPSGVYSNSPPIRLRANSRYELRSPEPVGDRDTATASGSVDPTGNRDKAFDLNEGPAPEPMGAPRITPRRMVEPSDEVDSPFPREDSLETTSSGAEGVPITPAKVDSSIGERSATTSTLKRRWSTFKIFHRRQGSQPKDDMPSTPKSPTADTRRLSRLFSLGAAQ